MLGLLEKVAGLKGREFTSTMRWRFAETDEEVKHRARVLEQIDRWWGAFVERTDEIAQVFTGDGELDLPGWMTENLQRIDPRLTTKT